MIVVAEWESYEEPNGVYEHRIVLKDEHGTVVKTSLWNSYRGIASIDYGGVQYRAATDFYDGDLPTKCVFTVTHPPRCETCGGATVKCETCSGTRYQPMRVETPDESVGVATGRGPHGTPGHRCSGFCPEYACEHGTRGCRFRGEKHSCPR